MADPVAKLRTYRPAQGREPQSPRGLSSWLIELYREHADSLRRHLRRKYGPGPPDPEDIAQDAFARLAAIDAKQLAAIAHRKAFLYRTAENLLISAKRRARTAAAHIAEGESADFESSGFDCTPERVLLTKDQLDVIERAIRDMPEKRRRCLLMHRFDGLGFAEIGRRLGISATGVRGHVERAMQDIEKALAAAAHSPRWKR